MVTPLKAKCMSDCQRRAIQTTTRRCRLNQANRELILSITACLNPTQSVAPIRDFQIDRELQLLTHCN
jgi:hypothetical protein